MLWRGEITKAQPEVVCMDTVITSALLTNGTEYKLVAVGSSLVTEPLCLDLAGEMLITAQYLYRPLILLYIFL